MLRERKSVNSELVIIERCWIQGLIRRVALGRHSLQYFRIALNLFPE